MGTGRPRTAYCRYCDRHEDVCGPLSARKICAECAVTRMAVNAVELAAMQGESLLRWRARTILAAGGILPDELKPYAE